MSTIFATGIAVSHPALRAVSQLSTTPGRRISDRKPAKDVEDGYEQ